MFCFLSQDILWFFRDFFFASFVESTLFRGSGVAQSVKCPTLDFRSGVDPRVMGSSPTLKKKKKKPYFKKKENPLLRKIKGREKKKKSVCCLTSTYMCIFQFSCYY